MHKHNILLLDNNEESLNLLNQVIGSKCQIDLTIDIDNVQSIILSNDRLDLILLDTSVKSLNSDLDAYELARILKRDARCSEVPIIFFLHENDKDSINKCYEYGGAECISKPFHHGEFKSKVKNILQLFHLRDSLSNALEDRQRHIVTIQRQLNAIDEYVLYINLDLNHNICDASTAFVNLLACTKEEIIKRNKHCLSKEELGLEKFNEVFEGVEEAKPHISEIKTKISDNQTLCLEVKIAKDFDYFDNHIGYVATFHDITDKKIIEKKNIELDRVNYELDENMNYLKQFKKAVEETSIFSITDSQGTIKEVNKNFEAISGYSKEELIGQAHNIVRHEDMPKEAFRQMWKTIKSGNIWKGMVKNKRKDGKGYYVLSEVMPIKNSDGSFREYISIRTDVTELEEYKQVLKNDLDTKNRSLEENINYITQYEDAIDNSIAILKTNTEHIIHYANEKFCKLSGYNLEELIGKDCVELRDEIHRSKEDCKNIAKILNEKKSVSKVMTNIKKTGEKYYSNTLFYPIVDTSGKVVENLQVMYDISEIINLNKEIINTQKEVVFTMGAIGEARSQETGDHVKRVAEYSYLIAKIYGLDEKETELLKQASPMHDIGKVAIPDSILKKPAKLSYEEFEVMKTHSEIGYEMLKHSDRPILKASAQVAYTHHERYDGTGYPEGLKGEEIPIFGRITAIADVFDALDNNRVYKQAWDLDEILELFREERGKHFDPKLVDIFFDNLDEFIKIRDEFN
ncbi:PAS domain S-box protein [Sulfurimonas sp.]|uniref:PAS domain S-box protein n=1 Tax=Sulfurimonas sp. TaxID=2022749 RepID=UPI0025D98937|nr:PAS domain S-box protein [Sulfurimonas sp.]